MNKKAHYEDNIRAAAQIVKDAQYAHRSILNDAKIVYLHEDIKGDFELIYEGETALAKYYYTPFNIINLYDHREAALILDPDRSLLNSIMIKLARKLFILNQGLESREERHNIYRYLSAYYYEWLEFFNGSRDFDSMDFDIIVDKYLKVLDAIRSYEVLEYGLTVTRRVVFIGSFLNLPVKKRQQMSREIQNLKRGIVSKANVFSTVNEMLKGGLLVNGTTVKTMVSKKGHPVLSNSIKTEWPKNDTLSLRQIKRVLEGGKEVISKHNKEVYGTNSSATAKKIYDLVKTDVPEWANDKNGRRVSKKLKPFADALKNGFTYTGELLDVDENIKIITGVDSSAAMERYVRGGEYVWDTNEPLAGFEGYITTDDQLRYMLNPTSVFDEALHYISMLTAKEMLEDGKSISEVTKECIDIGLINIGNLAKEL